MPLYWDGVGGTQNPIVEADTTDEGRNIRLVFHPTSASSQSPTLPGPIAPASSPIDYGSGSGSGNVNHHQSARNSLY